MRTCSSLDRIESWREPDSDVARALRASFFFFCSLFPFHLASRPCFVDGDGDRDGTALLCAWSIMCIPRPLFSLSRVVFNLHPLLPDALGSYDGRNDDDGDDNDNESRRRSSYVGCASGVNTSKERRVRLGVSFFFLDNLDTSHRGVLPVVCYTLYFVAELIGVGLSARTRTRAHVTDFLPLPRLPFYMNSFFISRLFHLYTPPSLPSSSHFYSTNDDNGSLIH
jgi:hypothetical protein